MASFASLKACVSLLFLSHIFTVVSAGHLHRHSSYRHHARAVTAAANTQTLNAEVAQLESSFKDFSAQISSWLASFGAQLSALNSTVKSTGNAAVQKPKTKTASVTPSATNIPSTIIVASRAGSTATPTTTSKGFNPSATNNVAVYYGQTTDTKAGGLVELCSSASVDIINVAFLYKYFSAGGYPTAEFGPGCWSPNSEQEAAGATGLVSCPSLASEISQCQQQYGKIILVSLGGYIAESNFTSAAQAKTFANTIWNLFGAGTGLDAGMRPFGSTVVDGFDIDNEDGLPQYYLDFATELRRLYGTVTSGRRFYIGAAPQCPRPDASIPESVIQTLADFVWVQFYNNPSCNFNTGGDFLSSFQAWSKDLAAGSNSPRLFIGTGAWTGAGSGYVTPGDLPSSLKGVKDLAVKNLGGMMFWDGSEGLLTKDPQGRTYMEAAKAALQ